jgi:hypothetical protein
VKPLKGRNTRKLCFKRFKLCFKRVHARFTPASTLPPGFVALTNCERVCKSVSTTRLHWPCLATFWGATPHKIPNEKYSTTQLPLVDLHKSNFAGQPVFCSKSNQHLPRTQNQNWPLFGVQPPPKTPNENIKLINCHCLFLTKRIFECWPRENSFFFFQTTRF